MIILVQVENIYVHKYMRKLSKPNYNSQFLFDESQGTSR